jgi:hypothetical protein
VYSVALDVAAAVRARTLDVVVAIYFYLFLVVVPLILGSLLALLYTSLYFKFPSKTPY